MFNINLSWGEKLSVRWSVVKLMDEWTAVSRLSCGGISPIERKAKYCALEEQTAIVLL